MRAGKYKGWLPTLFVGNLLQNKTVGIIGAGRIGAAYARMMVEGHKMDLVGVCVCGGKDGWGGIMTDMGGLAGCCPGRMDGYMQGALDWDSCWI